MNCELEKALTGRLLLIFKWYEGMIDRKTGRLEYMYYPQSDFFSEASSPIREIASVWEMELLSDFLKRNELEPYIDRSLDYFRGFRHPMDGYFILDAKQLGEPSSIAHSAFMILALLHSRIPDRVEQVSSLAEGILKQQRKDGSYKIFFNDEPDFGLEFYPGEAMLALLEAYAFSGDHRYLESVERGFGYYSSWYFQRGLSEENLLVFFANWQSQFCRLLFQHTRKDKLRSDIRDYIFHLQDLIIEEGYFSGIRDHPERQSSVEAACALEGLNDAYLLTRGDRRLGVYRECICLAIPYLLDVQCIKNCMRRERGGFGFSLADRTQRVDVTGHVVNAFIKTIRNNIEC